LRNGRAIAISKTEPPLRRGVSLKLEFWGKQMRLLTTIALAAGLAAMPAAAQAVDLLSVPTSSNESLPVADSGFDWNRFYAGVYGVGQSSVAGGGQFGGGLDLGVNGRFEFVLVGAEVAVQGLGGGAGGVGYVQGLGKAGLALSDDIVAYGAGGAGLSLSGPSESDALFGGGVELAVTDDVSVGARYIHGFPITGANPKDQVTIGANFHF
jgi:outer membrane immunogenic protein